MRSKGLFLLGLVALSAAVLPGRANAEGEAVTAASPPDERARFAGTYTYAGSAAEEAGRRAAIDRGIASLFFAIRGIARSRLSGGTKIEPWVSFGFDAGMIRVRVPSSPQASSPEQGPDVDYGNGDDKAKLSQRIGAGKVIQRFVASEGQRMNEWVRSPDGKTLTLKATISSPKLTAPVVYTLTYKRSS